MEGFNKHYKRMCALPKFKRDIKDTEVYKVYEKTGVVDFEPMLDELVRRTHLPKCVVKKVYEAEGDVLYDLGIIN